MRVDRGAEGGVVTASILLIEDEQLIRWALRVHLEDAGFMVGDVETGEDGLKRLAEDRFDLVLLDVRLPDANGLDVLRRLRQGGHQPAVLMMTAYTDPALAAEAKALGVREMIYKPFRVEAVVEAARRALGSAAG